jgi:signal transduction histidine kinase
MKIELSLSRKIALGFMMGVMILIFVGIVSYYGIREFTRSAAVVTQSHRVMTTIQETLGDVVSAESEVRGFIITGDERYLTLYKVALDEVENDLVRLRNLVTDVTIHARLDNLERLTRDRLDRLKKTVTIRRLEGLEGAVVAAGPGKKLMDELRTVIYGIEDIENQLVSKREQETRSLALRVTLVIVLGSLFAILLAAFSTVVLSVDVAHRERLEREVLEISEREQRRIGQDLHDGVCQHLTGIALLCRSLQQKLTDRLAPEASEAVRITGLINEGIEQTRRVTHGLHPVANEPSGLMVALQELANGVHASDQLDCQFECPEPVLIPDQIAATHLYRIAQEAVQNAIRHAKPTALTLRLESTEAASTLTITDDGCGLPPQRTGAGLGLEIMNYRASTIGAKLAVGPGAERGTVVCCVLPRDALA